MLVQYHTVTQYKRSISQSICIYINVQKAIVAHISYMQIYSDNVVLSLHTCDVVTRVGARLCVYGLHWYYCHGNYHWKVLLQIGKCLEYGN